MALLALSEELLLAIVEQVELYYLVNFSRTCKLIRRIAIPRLQQHREMMAKYSCLFINPEGPSKHYPGVWYVDHCEEAIDTILANSSVSHYIRKIIYIPSDACSPRTIQRRRAWEHKQLITTDSMDDSEELLNGYSIEPNVFHTLRSGLRQNSQNAFFSLLLLQARNLEYLILSNPRGEYANIVGEVLRARNQALQQPQTSEGLIKPLDHTSSALPKLKSISVNLGGTYRPAIETLDALLDGSALQELTLCGVNTNFGSSNVLDWLCKRLLHQKSLSTIRLLRGTLSAEELVILLTQVPQVCTLEYTHQPDLDLHDWRETWTAPGVEMSEEALLLRPLEPPLEEVFEELTTKHASVLSAQGLSVTLQGEAPKQVLKFRR